MEHYLSTDPNSPTNERMDGLTDEELEQLYYDSIEYDPNNQDNEPDETDPDADRGINSKDS